MLPAILPLIVSSYARLPPPAQQIVYVAELVCIILTTLLYTGCIPLKQGAPSLLSGIYALEIRGPGESSPTVWIGNFALCAGVGNEVKCSATMNQNEEKLASILGIISSKEDIVPKNALDLLRMALELQKTVFYGIPTVVGVFLVGILGIQLYLAFGKARRGAMLGKIAIVIAAISTLLLLFDAYSTYLAVQAVSIATSTHSRESQFTFQMGKVWMRSVFAFSVLLTSALAATQLRGKLGRLGTKLAGRADDREPGGVSNEAMARKYAL